MECFPRCRCRCRSILFFFFTLFFALCTAEKKWDDDAWSWSKSKSNSNSTSNSSLLRMSCIHAHYPSLCIHTLSSVASSAKTPSDLALAAVSVSEHRASNVSALASSLMVRGLGNGNGKMKMNKRERSALRDCIEQLSDSTDQLAHTMSELRHLRSVTFEWQMSNAETWVSAALTNEDTCLDGFQGLDGSLKKAMRRKIVNVARVTSNALYLVNLLASTHGPSP